jgi:methylated-DNA-protein-cysteine methyltransferase related protein
MSDEKQPIRMQTASLMARVFALVRACPRGRVTTYGWISKALGYPRGARMIGYIMHECPGDVPAQRVINSKGELTGSFAFGARTRMRELLEADGIVFSADGRVDLKRYGWDPSRDLTPEEVEQLLSMATEDGVTVNARLLHLLQDDPTSPLCDTSTESR